MMKRGILAALLALGPATAFAFETVDTLPFPSSGAFPGWPGDRGAEPWSIYAYGGLMYDSNAFRRDTDELDDIVARYGFGGRYAARVYGRQAVVLEAFGEYYDYNHLSEIDHFGYGLRGDWLWELGNQANGNIGYVRRHRHADLGEFQVERRSMGTTDLAFIDGGYRFLSDWRIFGALEWTRSSRDTDVFDALEGKTVRTALTYRTPLGNVLGIDARATRGQAPFTDETTGAATTVNDFDEREIAATLAYSLGAQLRIGGRIGYTTREYDDLPERDFEGRTWRGGLDWLPTGKLVFRFETYREPSPLTDIDAPFAIRTGALFSASWAATYKLVFTASYLNENRRNEGDPNTVLLGTPVRDETIHVWRFGVGWEPQRRWQLGAAIDFGDRTSNEVGRDYEYQQVMFNARFTF